MMAAPQSQRKRWLLRADILWIFALMAYVLAGTALVPFHADESTQIMMSRDYYYQFVTGDWDQVLYQDPPLNETEQQLRLLNGTVSKYIFGLAATLAGYDIDQINEQWLWGAGWDWNVENGHMPEDGLLLAARLSAALFAALSVPVVFALGWLVGQRPAAYAVSFLLATHPVILLNGRRAYMESTLLFFSLLVVLAAAWWGRYLTAADEANRRGRWWGPLLLALASGLAVASKHSGVVPVAASYLGLALLIVWRGWARRRYAIPALLVSGVLAIGVFVALNPAWWRDPVTRPFEVLDLRESLVAVQADAFPEAVYTDGMDRVGGMLYQLVTAPPAYFEVAGWADYIADPIVAYSASFWTGIQYGTNPLTIALGVIVFGLAVVGLLPLGQAIRTANPAALLIVLWGGLAVVFTLVAIPLAWQRYYMPLYPVEVLLAGIGAVWFYRAAMARARSLRTS
jgi:4-amino-4-deoxy-L-arabinose transferase-like glycosyltransferase